MLNIELKRKQKKLKRKKNERNRIRRENYAAKKKAEKDLMENAELKTI